MPSRKSRPPFGARTSFQLALAQTPLRNRRERHIDLFSHFFAYCHRSIGESRIVNKRRPWRPTVEEYESDAAIEARVDATIARIIADDRARNPPPRVRPRFPTPPPARGPGSVPRGSSPMSTTSDRVSFFLL